MGTFMSPFQAGNNPSVGKVKAMIGKKKSGLLLAVFFALSSVSLAQQDAYRIGTEYYANGNYEKAAEIWKTEANAGSVEAQFNMGILYYEGKGVEKDRQKSIFWFRRAAEAGHAQAQYNLGHLLLEKQQDLAKVKTGVGWWKKSAENGSILAQYNYGKALFYGLAIEQSLEQAHYWISKAARSGEGASQKFLEEHAEVFASLDHAEQERLRVAEENLAREMKGQRKILTSKQGLEVRSLDVKVKGLKDYDGGLYIKEELEASNTPNTQPANTLDANGADDEVDKDVYRVETDSGTINLKDYVLVKENQTTLYSAGNHSAFVIGEVAPNMLLRVVDKQGSWLSVQVPGGIPAWVRASAGELVNSFLEVTANPAVIYAKSNDDSGESQFGKLSYGTKLLFIDKKDDWYQVLIPELVPVWLESEFVKRVSAPISRVGSIWQAQRL
ncbi:MAG: hypothetical protein GKR95_03735 [Gammaproteobacteria bacterium]|nr:hypothetical protein [Gammaproteobacteria bacterium]